MYHTLCLPGSLQYPPNTPVRVDTVTVVTEAYLFDDTLALDMLVHPLSSDKRCWITAFYQ